MVGSVYWFLTMACDLSLCRVTIWDCTSETTVWDSDDHWTPEDNNGNVAEKVDFAGFGDYEIQSYDIWVEHGLAQIEINISIEEDEL